MKKNIKNMKSYNKKRTSNIKEYLYVILLYMFPYLDSSITLLVKQGKKHYFYFIG